MNKKLFVVSDVHGHYTELMEALTYVGFDEKNENHIFVSCGDLFDRGKENVQVYDFVKGLQQKILIKGNHEDSLCHVLKCGYVTEIEKCNGTDITILQMLGNDALDANGYFDRMKYASKIQEIKAFIDEMFHYYETEQYVFTHGWLPIAFEGYRPYIDQAWRDASEAEWEEAHSLEWQQLYSVRAMLDGKSIVCGHRPARLGYMFDELRDLNCSELFYGEGLIALDADTVRSGRVNVFVIEESETVLKKSKLSVK